jgi:hypothetical protein
MFAIHFINVGPVSDAHVNARINIDIAVDANADATLAKLIQSDYVSACWVDRDSLDVCIRGTARATGYSFESTHCFLENQIWFDFSDSNWFDLFQERVYGSISSCTGLKHLKNKWVQLLMKLERWLTHFIENLFHYVSQKFKWH